MSILTHKTDAVQTTSKPPRRKMSGFKLFLMLLPLIAILAVIGIVKLFPSHTASTSSSNGGTKPVTVVQPPPVANPATLVGRLASVDQLGLGLQQSVKETDQQILTNANLFWSKACATQNKLYLWGMTQNLSGSFYARTLPMTSQQCGQFGLTAASAQSSSASQRTIIASTPILGTAAPLYWVFVDNHWLITDGAMTPVLPPAPIGAFDHRAAASGPIADQHADPMALAQAMEQARITAFQTDDAMLLASLYQSGDSPGYRGDLRTMLLPNYGGPAQLITVGNGGNTGSVAGSSQYTIVTLNGEKLVTWFDLYQYDTSLHRWVITAGHFG